jgi:hypothetical protein
MDTLQIQIGVEPIPSRTSNQFFLKQNKIKNSRNVFSFENHWQGQIILKPSFQIQ